MDLRSMLTTGLLLTALLAFAPGASAAPCSGGPAVSCEATVGDCDVEAGANVITTTAAGASADCTGSDVPQARCYAEAGVGHDLLDPTLRTYCLRG